MKRLYVIFLIIVLQALVTASSSAEDIDPGELVEKAGNDIMIREYESALEKLEKAVEVDPDNSRAYLFMAQAYIGLKKYDKAIESYDKAINADPDSYIAWNGKGELLLRELKYDEALVCFEKSISLYKNAATAMYNLAIVYARKDDKAKCIEWLKKAVKKDPGLKVPARDEKAFYKYRNSSEFQEIVFD
ncbi:MAG: tetratricopeptide repeat protein [Candidatus Dadabacteria bacterium]|nr:tetratricopeptide repeat protein [Candidatus Dadabacteria bacterium]